MLSVTPAQWCVFTLGIETTTSYEGAHIFTSNGLIAV